MTETTSVSSTLDVIGKYNTLVKESLSGDSVYIRTKETLQELVKDGALDDAKKAEVISSVLGSAVNSITSSAMSSALEWSKHEKELELKKLEMDQQLLILKQDVLLKDAQVTQIKTQTTLAIAEAKRMIGVTYSIDTDTATDNNEGKVWQDMQLVKQQATNAGIEETLLGSKIDESKVAIHKIVADTYTNFGNFTFTVSDGGGLANVQRKDAVLVPEVEEVLEVLYTQADADAGALNGNQIGDVKIAAVAPVEASYTTLVPTLSDVQRDIAIEQGKGYTYNAWANALTGSASMLGTAIASGDFSMAADSGGIKLFEAVVNCAENLRQASSASSTAIPTSVLTVPPQT